MPRRATRTTVPVVTSRKLARQRRKSLGARTGLPRFVEDWLLSGSAGTARGRIASEAILHGVSVLVRRHPRAAAALTASVVAHLARGAAFEAKEAVGEWLSPSRPEDTDVVLDLTANEP